MADSAVDVVVHTHLTAGATHRQLSNAERFERRLPCDEVSAITPLKVA